MTRWTLLKDWSRGVSDMIMGNGFRPMIFSVNCYIAAILTLFIAFSPDLKSPARAMTTVYLTRTYLKIA